MGRSNELDGLTTLPELLEHSVSAWGDKEALRQFDRSSNTWESWTYRELGEHVLEWRRAFAAMGLRPGDRVAILMPNGRDHACADQAALANGLVPVPLHAIDTPGASAFITIDSQACALVTNKLSRWKQIRATGVQMPDLRTVLITDPGETEDHEDGVFHVRSRSSFLEAGKAWAEELPPGPLEDDLAGIVYTSGTTGRPKGVMLTHRNVVSNVKATLDCVSPREGDVFLSFLPLSHTFERTAGYYLALATGCAIAYNRSVLLLAEDLKTIRPNGMPMEKSSRAWLDGVIRATLLRRMADTLLSQFGGRLRIAISGGAALNHKVARAFCGLGLPIIQGYGMTEASPIIAGNCVELNQPDTVGKPFSNVEVRLGESSEIQIRGPSIMKGYWHRPEDTAAAFTKDGWLRTGDVGGFTAQGMLQIRGRIKEIIVTSTGEKIPPADLESAIETDPLFDQCWIVGENRPYLTLIAVVNPNEWTAFAESLKLDPKDPASLSAAAARTAALRRAKTAAADFPNYALPRAAILTTEVWTIENGLITPTLKLKRGPLGKKFAEDIARVYATHG